MTFTITKDMIEMQEAVQAMACIRGNFAVERIQSDPDLINRLKNQVGAVIAAEHACSISKQIEDRMSAIKRAIEQARYQAAASIARLKREVEAIDRIRQQAQGLRTDGRTLHRGQDGSTGKGKKSSGKTTGNSGSGAGGGDGGDSGGDGDGPQRKCPKKQRRTIKNRKTVPHLPPSSPPGSVVKVSPPPLSTQPSPGQDLALVLSVISLGYRDHAGLDLSQILAMIFVFILGLGALGMRELATRVWDSVPKLLSRLSNRPTDVS